MPLLIVGGTVVDLILPQVPRLPAWPKHQEFTADNLVLLAQPPLVTIGGNGANAAFVAARCGAEVTLHSNCGSDSLGTLARGWLSAAGCKLAASRGIDRTAVNVTATDAKLRRATFFYPGKEPAPPRSAEGCSYALVCGWPHPTPQAIARAFRAWHREGTQNAFDFGPLLGTEPRWSAFAPAVAEVDVLIGNEHEALTATGSRTLSAAVRRLREVCPGHLVIKLGARGVLWLAPAATVPERFPAVQVKAANTIGAGDSFNGALLSALDCGAPFNAALRSANEVAASVVRSPRGVLGAPTR